MRFDLRDSPYGRFLALFYEPRPRFTTVRTDANELVARAQFKRRKDLPVNIRECAITLLMQALPMDKEEASRVVDGMLDEHSIVLRDIGEKH